MAVSWLQLDVDAEAAPHQLPHDSLVPLTSLLISAEVVCFFGSLGIFDQLMALGVIQSYIIPQPTMAAPSTCTHLVFADLPADTVIKTLSLSGTLPRDKSVLVINRNTALNWTQREIEASRTVFGSAFVAFHHHGDATPFDGHYRRFTDFSDGSDDVLRGKSVSVLLDLNGPFSGQYLSSKHQVLYDGAALRLFRELARQLDFKLEPISLLVLVLRRGCSPAEVGNKTSDCWIHELTTDIVADVGFVWAQNLIALNTRLIGPVLSDMSLTALVRRPAVIGRTWLTLLAVFEPAVWISLAAAFALTTLAHWLAGRRRTSLAEGALDAWAALLLTGRTPRASAAGLVLCWWSLFAVLNAAAFTSDTLNRITLPVFTERVDTVQEIQRRGLKFYTDTLILALQESHRGGGKGYATDMRKHIDRLIGSHDDLILVGERHGPDTVVPFLLAEVISDEGLGRFRAIGENMNTSFHSVNFARDSPHSPALAHGVQRLVEAGVWQYQWAAARRRLRPSVRRLTVDEDRPSYQRHEPLTVDNLGPVLQAHVASLALALASLAVELVAFYYTNRTFGKKRANSEVIEMVATQNNMQV